MSTDTVVEAGLISPTGKSIVDGRASAEELAKADMDSAANLIEDAVLRLRQDVRTYEADGIAIVVDSAVNYSFWKLKAEPDEEVRNDPTVRRMMASFGLMTAGRASEQEAQGIIATYERQRAAQQQVSTTEKMVHLGSTVFAAEEVHLTPPRPLQSVAEIVQEAWRIPSLGPMLHTMIEMPGLDTAARSFQEEEGAWERSDSKDRFAWHGRSLEQIIQGAPETPAVS